MNGRCFFGVRTGGIALASLLGLFASRLAGGGVLPQGETTVSVGYGDNSHIDLGGGNVREDVTFRSLMISRRWAIREMQRGRGLQLAVEGSASHAEQEGDSRYTVGVTPFLLYNFAGSEKITAFAEAGLGLLYTDLDPERFGSRINFTPQAGVGLRYRLSDAASLLLSYRFHHISNAGLDADNNRSIDSNFFIVGVAFRR